MKYIERTFKLEGAAGLGRYPNPEMIGPILTQLPQTLQDAVRMGFLHSSRPRGRVADALRAAAQVRFVGHSAAGSEGTLLTFQVPRLGEAAPTYFEQATFWDEGLREDATAFDLLGDALRDIREERVDSPHFDQPFLRGLSAYGKLMKRGVSRISLPEKTGRDTPAMDSTTLSVAERLALATPPARRVRIAGRLDLMGASQGVLKLHVRSGEIVTALWAGAASIETHHELFNRDVVIEGLGVFRPSGSLLRVEADAIAAATSQDEFFRHLPVAQPATWDPVGAARLRAGEPSTYAAIRGAIPAEESDEDFAAAVDAFS